MMNFYKLLKMFRKLQKNHYPWIALFTVRTTDLCCNNIVTKLTTQGCNNINARLTDLMQFVDFTRTMQVCHQVDALRIYKLATSYWNNLDQACFATCSMVIMNDCEITS